MHPPLISSSSTLAITCPASRINSETLKLGTQILSEHGINLIIDETCTYASSNYFSAPDQIRLECLQYLLNHEQIQGILMGRGGYGITRIIDKLNWEKFKQYPKWIIGFSDITLLHLALYQFCNLESLHASMLEYLSDAESAKSLFQTLNKPKYNYEFNSNPYNRSGQTEGILLGGNLSLIIHSIGSNYFPNFKDAILFLEDTNENLYNIDRMLWQLSRSGIFTHLRGLVCGYFNNIQDSDPSFGENIYEIINYHFKDYPIPIAFDFPAGHQKPNLALRLGARHELKVGKDLSCLQIQ